MGQGRKKRERTSSGSNRRRRFSISADSCNRDSQDLLTLLGVRQDDRLSSAPNRGSSRKHSNSSLFKSTRHDSLVDYISPQLSNSLPTKPASNMQCSFVGDIPLVSTSSGTQSGLAQGIFLSARWIADFYQSKNALLLAESLFPTNSVFSGGKTKILSTDHLSNIRSVLQNLLAENEIEVDLTTYTTCSTSAKLHSNQQAEKNSCGPRSSPNYRAFFRP